MISISVNDKGQYRFGLHLTDEQTIGTCVRLGDWNTTDHPTWIAVDHNYPRRRFRHERIYECDVIDLDRCTLVAPFSGNDIALVRFNTYGGPYELNRGYTQKYWGSPRRIERALTLHDGSEVNRWEDAVYVMNPGDVVFIHPAASFIPSYLMRWNGDSLERFRVATFNRHVVRPWMNSATHGEVRIAWSNAKKRRHQGLADLLSEALRIV